MKLAKLATLGLQPKRQVKIDIIGNWEINIILILIFFCCTVFNQFLKMCEIDEKLGNLKSLIWEKWLGFAKMW
jgi:hypothetical protein